MLSVILLLVCAVIVEPNYCPNRFVLGLLFGCWSGQISTGYIYIRQLADFCGEVLDGDDEYEYENPTDGERLTTMHHIIIIIIDLANLRHLV